MTGAEEFDPDIDFDLFMLTDNQLATRAMDLADRCCRRAATVTEHCELQAVRTAFRAVHLALALARRAETVARRDTYLRSIP